MENKKEQKYYIVSQKHTLNDQIFVLWSTDFSGYTQDADKAGKYTEKEVRKAYGDQFPILNTSIQHVDTKIGNFLIPVEEEALERIGLKKMYVITYR